MVDRQRRYIRIQFLLQRNLVHWVVGPRKVLMMIRALHVSFSPCLFTRDRNRVTYSTGHYPQAFTVLIRSEKNLGHMEIQRSGLSGNEVLKKKPDLEVF